MFVVHKKSQTSPPPMNSYAINGRPQIKDTLRIAVGGLIEHFEAGSASFGTSEGRRDKP